MRDDSAQIEAAEPAEFRSWLEANHATTSGVRRLACLLVDRAKADGSWNILDGPEAGLVPDDLAAALHEADAREGFDSLTFGARKAILTWINLAKRDTTRTTRITKTVAAVAAGRSPLA